MRGHYHVNVGTRGYLPDNSYPVATLKDAREAAKEEARNLREQGYRVRGSARYGWYETIENDPYRISLYVSIDPCTDSCLDDLDA